VRIGLFSDSHCNVAAVETAIAAMAETCDEILCLGDIVYEYRMCSDTVDLIRKAGVRAIQGNHDVVLLGPHGERARSRPHVRPDSLEYLASLPQRVEVSVGHGKRLLMVHGSPFEPYGDYLGPSHPALKRCAELDVDYVVFGHTHVPLSERAGSVLVVNPGSVGESREPGQRDVVSYAILDTESDEVEHVRFANPR
jgi:putative phosphoesterase